MVEVLLQNLQIFPDHTASVSLLLSSHNYVCWSPSGDHLPAGNRCCYYSCIRYRAAISVHTVFRKIRERGCSSHAQSGLLVLAM